MHANRPGSVLGLSIVSAFTQLHDGEVFFGRGKPRVKGTNCAAQATSARSARGCLGTASNKTCALGLNRLCPNNLTRQAATWDDEFLYK